MTAEDLRDLLLANDLITETQKPNSTHQYVARCFDCDKKKLYVKCDEDEDDYGAYFCQHCETKGSGQQLVDRFTPPSEEQTVYKVFHEYAVRQLLKNESVLNGLLTDRDFTEEDIKTFGFGYVGKTFVQDLVKSGKVTKNQLIEYGFINNNDGNSYPIFWNHIIIPYISHGIYENFKGRNLDKDAKVKYIGLLGHDSTIYGAEDLRKPGRVFLTEGEFKRAYLKSNGYNASSLSGARNYHRYLQQLRSVEDLWIVLDVDRPTDKDPIGVGQDASIKIAKQLDRCHVVFLPLGEDEDKIGVDDYMKDHGPEEFERLLESADYYEDGEKQKPRSLAIVVTDWKAAAKGLTKARGFNIGFPRLNTWLHGAWPGSLGYCIGPPHNGKTALLRAMSLGLYNNNPELVIDYHSNDDSTAMTIGHFVAAIGGLNAAEASEPSVAYAKNKKLYRQWEDATESLEMMSKRFRILDRSYRIAIEDIYEEVMHWRDKNPEGQRAILIDGFMKTYSRAAVNMGPGEQVVKKSDQLKLLAQEASVFVFATINPPKLYGRRPRGFDIANAAEAEFDADIIMSAYIDAVSKGLDSTDLKIIMDYDDDFTDTVPLIEINVHKNKQNGISDIDLFVLHKNTSELEELEDDDHTKFKKMVLNSVNNEFKPAFKLKA